MAWRIKEEHLDVAEGLHRIIYENPAVLTRDGKPQEHHVAIFLKLESCPYCGHAPAKDDAGEVDVQKIRQQMHERLNQHHEQMMGHGRKHGVPHLNGGPSAR